MERTINYDFYDITISWEETLVVGSRVHINAIHEALATIALEILLDELGLHNLWYDRWMYFNGSLLNYILLKITGIIGRDGQAKVISHRKC